MDRPSIIPRSEIPMSHVAEDSELDVRQFRAHALLGKIMPGSDVSVAWSHVRQDQEVSLRSDAKPGLLIIVHGRAELVGPRARALYHDALRFWISKTGALLFVRQAGCADAKYAQTFLLQTRDELDRGILVDSAVAVTSLSYQAARDPILLAFADWFARQMYVLDNVEKVAVVDLVVTSANAALGRTDTACRFWAQGHEERRAETELLLRGESARTYERLHAIVAEAWDMIGAMTDRIAELICKKY